MVSWSNVAVGALFVSILLGIQRLSFMSLRTRYRVKQLQARQRADQAVEDLDRANALLEHASRHIGLLRSELEFERRSKARWNAPVTELSSVAVPLVMADRTATDRAFADTLPAELADD